MKQIAEIPTVLKSSFWILLLLVWTASVFAQEKPYVILVSFDGFRWDYPDRDITPILDRFKEDGVSAKSLQSCFPTKTFPNHYSIVTGLYPEHHGIIKNAFLDPFTGSKYSYKIPTSVKEEKWYLGEALWETAQRQGIRCASYFWPGSEIAAPHRRPAYVEPYDHFRSNRARIDGIISWLQLPENERPHFIATYLHTSDDTGHIFGPDSPQMDSTIIELDGWMGELIEGLHGIGMLQKTNIILVSDHGMIETSSKRVVDLDSILETNPCLLQGDGPVVMIEPFNGNVEAAFELMQKHSDHFSVYRKQDVPSTYHFSAHPFISSILAVADPGWSLIHKDAPDYYIQNEVSGNHGFDNHLMDMHGVFLALGPAFKAGYQTGTLRNIDIYPLLCAIFGIEGRPVDGTLDNIGFILKEE